MKKLLLLTLFIFSTSIFAQNPEWGDISYHDYFTITQDIMLDSGAKYSEGSEFKFLTQYGLPYINVMVMEFDDLSCKDMSLEDSEPTLVLPKGADTSRDRRVFVRRALDCVFEVYVEFLDYYSESFFKESRLLE